MRFNNKGTLTKVEQKTSQKTQNQYLVLTILDPESGITHSCMYKGTDPFPITEVKKMESYNFHYDLSLGKYTSLNVVGVDLTSKP